MNRYSPIVTLLAVVLLGAGLLGVNVVSNPGETASEAAGEARGETRGGTGAPAGQAAAAFPGAPPLPAAEPPPVPDDDASAAGPAVVEKAYTGRSAGDEVTVAVAVKDGKAVAYVCDGENVEAWLEGTLTGETLALSGKTGTVTGTLDDKAAFGTVVVDGAEWPFSARGVAAPAGLYEGRGLLGGVAARVGWIVEEDGRVTGVLTAGGESSRAPVLDLDAPGATTLEGRSVAVTAVAGDATVVRR
jgi:hypothetical protein